MRTQGEGGQWQKADVLKFKFLPKFWKFKWCPVCLKSTFDSTTNHLNLSPMFLNCLLLDLTVIDLMSIVHMDQIWVEIAKNFEMRTSGGRGGLQ